VDRQLPDRALADRGADIGARGFDDGRDIGDGDGFTDGYAQLQIEVELLADSQRNRAVFVFSKSFRAGADFVGAGRQSGYAIEAARVRSDFALQAGVNVFNRDFGAGYRGVVRVSYYAFDSRGRGLLPEDRRDESEGEQRCDHDSQKIESRMIAMCHRAFSP